MNLFFISPYTYHYHMQYLAYFKYQQQCNVIRSIMHSIENLFTEEHLNKDVFIRSVMDDEGWVNVNYIRCYTNIKKLHVSKEMMRCVIMRTPSQEIEYQLRGNNAMYIRSQRWKEVKKHLVDIVELKRRRIGIMQNGYIATKSITKPRGNMRPMRSILQRDEH